MKPRNFLIFVGTVCGLVLGALAALQVAALGLGVSWLFLFGDDPWPEETGRIVFFLAVACGVCVLLLCVELGRRIGTQLEAQDSTLAPGARMAALLLLGLAIGLAGAMVAGLLWQDRKLESQRQAAAEHRARFTALSDQIVRIDAVAVDQPEKPAPLTLVLSFGGERKGPGHLTWVLKDKTYGRTLLAGNERLDLGPDTEALRIPLGQDLIEQAYREVILNGAGGVLVEENLVFQAMLVPELSDRERKSLSAQERQNLNIGISPLISYFQQPVPIAFTLP